LTVSLRDSARRILPLAWPVIIGQLAVLGFGTVDTVLAGRHAALDLAALAVGSAAYVTIFIGLMGVVLAIGPIAGRLHGAGHHAEAGAQLHQTVWLALALALPGCLLLGWPQPFLAMAKAPPEVAAKVRGYLGALAFALPASLLFTAYRSFNTAVSRPKAVMVLQLGGLALKVPLSWLLIGGGLGLPALGVAGCGVATALVMWCQLLAALVLLRRDPFYRPFALWGHGLQRPQWTALRQLLKLGLPIGASILIEVTGFAFMAIFISRLGPTAVAGHQIAANLVAMLYMLPLGLANATSALVAQRIGAGDTRDARQLGWHGLQLALLIALGLGCMMYGLRSTVIGLYTRDAAIAAATLPLVSWVVLFHAADATQAITSFVLRAWHVTTLPVLIYALALWGIGLGGGWLLAFGDGVPSLHGARGFWAAGTASLAFAAVALVALLAWVMKQRCAERLLHPRQPQHEA
jgi:MATE family multidrug resistance protein